MLHRFAAGLALAFAVSVQAVDTAFWKPYETDAATFLLERFDAEGAPAGRFGGAHQGPEGVSLTDELYLSGKVSMECWVKLSTVPEERAHLIRRRHEAGTTRGFELFLEPTGAVGMAVQNCLGTRTQLLSPEGLAVTGEWMHVAGVSVTGDYQVLYVNGHEVARAALAGGHGLTADGQKERVGSAIVVGEGVPGLLDEVRVHTNITKLWPKPEQSWLTEVAPLEQVLAPAAGPVLHLDFDGSVPEGIVTEGAYVDGVHGQAFRGRIAISDRFASAAEGAITFWSRPVGINNYSDQNVTLLSTSLFSFYLFNTTSNFRPLTAYYRDNQGILVFAGDRLGTEVYPERWYHYALSWGSGKFEWYVDGEAAGSSEARFGPEALLDVTYNHHRLFGDVDEVHIFDRALSASEAANLYWRHVDASRLREARAKLADLRFWHLPSSRDLHVQISPANEEIARSSARLQVRDEKGELVFSADASLMAEDQHFKLPELASGNYALNLKIGDRETDPLVLKRQRFAWEGNDLGMTDEVFPPFTPVKAGPKQVETVLREHQMNRFGLWESVVAQGRELLAAPMRLTAVNEAGGELEWEGDVELVTSAAHEAVYRARSRCAALSVETTSTMEPDGMMRVSMRLEPVGEAVALQRLSIEIPMREAEATLLHEVLDSIRRSYAGAMPSGDGEIWTSRQTYRQPSWLNAFTGYIWMGGPERGIAWFAENDRGWITAKDFEQPIMRIVRSEGRVTLRVDLINVPGVVREASELVFGLQASPTKPTPEDYRTKALTLGGVGLPVHPWGGLSCSWKSPWMDNWEVVDKVIEGRNEGRVDRAWFERFQEEHDVPKIHGVKDWVEDVVRFASQTKPLTNPDPVYFEEMAVLPFIPEYHVFQDEWSRVRLPEKQYGSVDIYRKSGGREINPNAPTNYSRSYQDYALALMDEWMKRGVSMYWDNTYLKVSTNPWTSGAYMTADGRIQPATTMWNQRQYMERTWKLMNTWRRRGVPRPLEFVSHMTNANLLPLFSWSTCNYDIEMSQSVYANAFPESYQAGEPYRPEFLLAESTGLQVGAYPYIVHNLFIGQSNLPEEALGMRPGQIELGHREWGMRAVHEIIRGGPRHYQMPLAILDRALYSFGYGTDRVKVWRYWDDKAAFRVDNDEVKGLLVSRATDGALFLVLQSWSSEAVTATVDFVEPLLGFAPGAHGVDMLRNRPLTLENGRLTVELAFPFETGIYLLREGAREAELLFADNFDGGTHAGWDYLPGFGEPIDGALRLGPNVTSWQGPPRLFEWLDLPDYADAELSFRFRIESMPAANAEVMTVRFPAEGVNWSKHGLTHSHAQSRLRVQLFANAPAGWRWRLFADEDGKARLLKEGTGGTVDTAFHAIRIQTRGESYSLHLDDEVMLEVDHPLAAGGSAFEIAAVGRPETMIGALWLDDIQLRAPTSDGTRLEQRREKALASAAEVLANRDDGLKKQVDVAFGFRQGPAIWKLVFFRHPEADAAELVQLLRRAGNAGQQRVVLGLLGVLPERQREHVESMRAIGQPADRLPQFLAARQLVIAQLRPMLDVADGPLHEMISETLTKLTDPPPQ